MEHLYIFDNASIVSAWMRRSPRYNAPSIDVVISIPWSYKASTASCIVMAHARRALLISYPISLIVVKTPIPRQKTGAEFWKPSSRNVTNGCLHAVSWNIKCVHKCSKMFQTVGSTWINVCVMIIAEVDCMTYREALKIVMALSVDQQLSLLSWLSENQYTTSPGATDQEKGKQASWQE